MKDYEFDFLISSGLICIITGITIYYNIDWKLHFIALILALVGQLFNLFSTTWTLLTGKGFKW